MITTEQKTIQIDALLNDMAEELQLDDTRKARMKQHYEAVKDWIESDEQFFRPYKYDVYPHGSVRIRTTVRPYSQEEFDLDIAVHLKSGLAAHTPFRIYQELKRRLAEHEAYKKMLELKNRCLRLNYAGDFHMDILPGIQESPTDENKLLVPDRELGSWVSSNPRGYADWFLAQANRVQESLLEKALRAEKLPTDNYRDKKPLQRAVQLIKRYRDMHFSEDDRFKTSSVILTTIAGRLYGGQESIFDTVDGIIGQLVHNINTTPGRIRIVNPVNPAEDFTDKWEGVYGYYTAFGNFARKLYQQWQELKKEQGVIQESQIMKELFGNEVFTKAQTQSTVLLENMRKKSILGIDRKTGVLTSAASAGNIIKPNTFFGA